MNLQVVNVILLGAAFHLIFFSFQTSIFIQQTVVNSIKLKPEYNFTGDGYLSLCITYAVFALSNWLAPSVVSITGIKYGMFLGACTYVIYSASFIYPTTWLFYSAAALVGFGASPLWTAQGSYLAKNSDADTSTRNAGLFWSMFQSSILFGNLFVYFAFNNQTIISDNTRYVVYSVLTIVCALGTLLILGLRDNSRCLNISEENPTALGQFLGALQLAKTTHMVLLSTAFLFTGVLLSFFTGVYGTAIGATPDFGPDSKKYIGLSAIIYLLVISPPGVFIGIGEIVGGSVFGLMGKKVNKAGRDTTVVLGYLVTIVALVLIYINLPPDSSIAGTATMISIIKPRIWLALLCSGLIGFGDACFNTQIYSLLMSGYTDNSVAAFALFKFMQSIGSAMAFFYSTLLNLHHQIYLLTLFGSIATLSFCIVEWDFRNKINKSVSQEQIVTVDNISKGDNLDSVVNYGSTA